MVVARIAAWQLQSTDEDSETMAVGSDRYGA